MSTMIQYVDADGVEISEDALHDLFDDMIDESHNWPTIMGVQMMPSRILKSVDPVAYRTSFNDWTDSAGYDEI